MAKKAGNKSAKFDYKTIKTFEDACKKLGIDSSKLPDVSGLLEEFAKPIIAHYKLIIIYKAINNGWVPDWNNSDQYKYYPWFWVLSSGFGFTGSLCDFGNARVRMSALAFALIHQRRQSIWPHILRQNSGITSFFRSS